MQNLFGDQSEEEEEVDSDRVHTQLHFTLTSDPSDFIIILLSLYSAHWPLPLIAIAVCLRLHLRPIAVSQQPNYKGKLSLSPSLNKMSLQQLFLYFFMCEATISYVWTYQT